MLNPENGNAKLIQVRRLSIRFSDQLDATRTELWLCNAISYIVNSDFQVEPFPLVDDSNQMWLEDDEKNHDFWVYFHSFYKMNSTYSRHLVKR